MLWIFAVFGSVALELTDRPKGPCGADGIERWPRAPASRPVGGRWLPRENEESLRPWLTTVLLMLP